MTRLFKLPKTHLKATARLRPAKNGEYVEVRLKNTSAALAFQVRLAVEAGKPSEEILPVPSGKIITFSCCPERNGLSSAFPQ